MKEGDARKNIQLGLLGFGLLTSFVSFISGVYSLASTPEDGPNALGGVFRGLVFLSFTVLGIVFTQAGLVAREHLLKDDWQRIADALQWRAREFQFSSTPDFFEWIKRQKGKKNFLLLSNAYDEKFLAGLRELMAIESLEIEIIRPDTEFFDGIDNLYDTHPDTKILEYEPDIYNFPDLILVNSYSIVLWPGEENSPDKWRVLAHEDAEKVARVYEMARALATEQLPVRKDSS